MHLIVLGGLFLLAIYAPGWWVRRVMNRYSQPADRYQGTGAQLARHLLDRLQINGVSVEETDRGDHYDPDARAVRLSPDNYHGRSLTAITVAAHEVGHAIQHEIGYAPFRARDRLVRLSMIGQKIGGLMLIGIPVILFLTKHAGAGLLMFLAGFLTMGLAAVVHFITLPTEFDASFNRALPMLEQGGYLRPEDARPARRILKAAALTYVAQSLGSLLNIWTWLRALRH
ncbi:MAG: zinc metallopeptidase [Halothiobacillaceae bacterium]